MFNKWSLVDIKFLKTGTYEEIEELECPWCKLSKEKCADILKQVLTEVQLMLT
jgi:hypothetical protein